jgi:glycosyltransferase involved in cell wall biosynthesis
VTFKDYPQAIAWGGFDLAIAPLLEHPFNEAKSNIKWLEAGIQDIPTVCSDVGSFRDDIPPGAAIKLGQSRESWVDGLKAALEDSFLREKTLQLAKEAIRDEWTIDRRGHFWENVVEEVIGLPRIESREDAQLQPHSAPVAAVD